MQSTVSVVVRRQPGLLAQIVSAVLREGCKLINQNVVATTDAELQRFTLTLEIPESAAGSVAQVLRGFGELVPEQRGSARTAAAPAEASLETVFAELVDSYPAIGGRVQRLALSLPAAERAAALSALGERLGRREYLANYSLGSPLKLEAALRRMVAPALRRMAKIEVDGFAVRLPDCPFCTGLRGTEPSCDFLTGFLKGFLDAAPATAGTAVRETHCHAAGDRVCEFVCTPA